MISKGCWLALCDLESNGKLDLRKTDELLSCFRSSLVCDARNIFDGIVKVATSGLQMEEKRTAIELLAVKERLKQANLDLKWVHGEQELADGLTKPWKHEPLITALDRNEWRIIYDPAFQSARRKRALGIQNVDLIHWLHCLFALEHWARRKLHRCWNGTDGCSIAINKCLSRVSSSELTAQITPFCWDWTS